MCDSKHIVNENCKVEKQFEGWNTSNKCVSANNIYAGLIKAIFTDNEILQIID